MTNAEDSEVTDGIEELKNRVWDAPWTIRHNLIAFIDLYGFSFLEQCISVTYAIYLQLTPFNLVMFLLKYVPMGIFTYKYIKSIHAASRERLKQKRTELEDIQLQIQIVNTKMCVRDAQLTERAELLRRESARLRRVRERVRDAIAADDTLRHALHAAPLLDPDVDMLHDKPHDDNEFVMELLNSLKRDHYAKPERNFEKMDCVEHGESDLPADQSSFYSSLSDIDERQDCSVKIVKVTNVYKVAYLKHYIKQKRLRRATKRAALKKKMENIKKLLEDWHKTLSMIINNKLNILNIDTYPVEGASQEAMGDYSKPHESSDSDSDKKNDVFYDDYSLSWMQNPHRPYSCSCEEYQDSGLARDYYEPQDNGDMKYSPFMPSQRFEKSLEMMSIKEETCSQIAVEEVAGDANDCRDLVAI